MKLQILLIMSVLSSLTQMVEAQQSIGRGSQVHSPEIHKNNCVSFRIEASAADEVLLFGDWMPSKGWSPGFETMQADAMGQWSFTTDVLEPELYTYYFMVDGVRVSDPNNAFQLRDIATSSSIFFIEGEKAKLYMVNDVPHGTVAKRWYDSPGNMAQRRLTIYTPPGYEDSGESYPVLYLLHGAGGDEEAWMELGRASQIMDNLIARGKARHMIVVMPNGNVIQDAAPGEGIQGLTPPRFMLPKTMDGTFEETFPEIMTFVESQYRVKADKGNRAIAGLSMGGFHAANISRYYASSFDYIGLFSAAMLPPQNPGSKIYANVDATLKVQKEIGYKLYWIAIGKEDFLYKANETFRKQLDAQGMVYSYHESEGGHVWPNWRKYLSELVPLLFEH